MLCARAGALAGAAASGRISFPTSGAAAAQAPFIRGVLLLHSFEYDDAIAAFREAQKADPGFAMAYWGEALCYNQPLWYNENLDKARAVLNAPRADAARRGRPRRRPRARRDISTPSSGCSATATRRHATAPTPIAWRSCHAQFPDDDEASAFYALALLATIPSGEREPPVSLQAGDIAPPS